MEHLLIVSSLVVCLLLTQNAADGKSPYCIPDVSLPKSCKGRKSEDITSSGAPVESEITYILHTTKNEPVPTLFIPGDEKSFQESGYNIKEETKIIVHGYFSSAKYFEHLVFAYLAAADHNIILMDWSGLAKWCYCEHVLKIIGDIGKELGKLIEFLVDKGTPLNKIHIIGHSLGAHIAGVGSVTCSRGRVGRITALDPARPGFSEGNNVDRLEKSRANLVDVIHTSAHTFGIAEPIGHYDFYPNGGQAPQPGCTGVTSEICSHSRSHYLFADSITTDVGFCAVKCSSWTNFKNNICTAKSSAFANMGSRLNKSSEEGTYYLVTGATCPYYIVGTSASGSVTPILTLLTCLSLLVQSFPI